MSKIIGIDYGTQRIGLAISDDGWQFAVTHDTFEVNKDGNFIDYLHDLCKQEDVKEIVIGLPLDQHGQQGDKAKEVLKFAEQVKKKCKRTVNFEDERFTSVMAKQQLDEAAKKHKHKKGLIDQGAAKIILQSYLDKK